MSDAMSNKKLNAIITIGGEVAGSLRTAIGSTTSQLSKIGSEIQRVKKQQSMLGESIRTFGSMGKNVDNLRARYSGVTDELNRLTRAQEKLNHVENLRQKNADIRSGSAKVLGGAMAASATMIVPVKLAIDFESSMADVKKVFSGTDAQFKTITNEVLKMSTVLPMAATDIAKIVASGAQSGIAANELTKFAESAVKMGVAFDVSAEEAGQSMAEMRTAFKMSQDEVITLADKINFLGNSTPAAAKGIMEIVQRIGPLGEVGGFASGSIAALGATMRGMGVQEEIAATGIKNMMLALIAGESATKSQRNAMIDLGLDSEEVAKSMQKDAEGTTLKILELIKALPKEKQGAMLATLFGKESLSAIAPLLTNMGALEENLKKVGDATKYAGSMNDEYKARAETTANNIILFKNKIAELGISIGSVLLPPLNIFLGKMGAVIDKVSAWSKANPELSSTLTKVAVGAIAVVGGIAAVALAVTTVIGPIALAISSFSVLGSSAGTSIGLLTKMITPIKMIGTAFSVVGKAMLANPMVLAIVAIVAVVAGAAYLIYKNWEPIKGFFSNLWSGVKDAFSSAWNGIKGVVGTGIEFIKGVIKSIDTVFADNPILNLLIPIIGIPRIIIANWSSIKGFFVSLWGGIKSSAESMWSSISSGASNAWNSIVGFFNPIGNWFAAKWEGVKLLTGAVWVGIKSIVSAAWNGLISIITNSSLFQSVVNGWTRIFDYLGTLKDKMLNIGKNIIDGLVSGIKSGFDSLKSTWASINNYMPSFMKKKMDIHSPSRVMAGLGGHIVDGIGVGMLQRKPALESQFNSVLGTFNSSANTPSINAISPSPRSTTPSMGGNSQSNAVNDKKQDITIVIHAAPGQDVNQLADLVAQKLNRAKAAIKRGSMLDAGYAQ
ncbi:phage tail tape measure protein [Acinetobacter johnsonii]|uniref:Phage tail tape measure protein n=1 Tax=Acinetobacter johnsonii TaxID=40214 RepID=A0AA42IGV1_ACIJO|nr:phage tail tape measure protein [Acinetobacter johnsonii]MDH0657651.1 phage tail tape measure protein [Acinetobacter johnsonii]